MQAHEGDGAGEAEPRNQTGKNRERSMLADWNIAQVLRGPKLELCFLSDQHFPGTSNLHSLGLNIFSQNFEGIFG